MSAATRLRRQQRRRRAARRLRATAGGYFWIPCPLCGEAFGGHEWVGRISLPGENDTQTKGICPACELDLGAQAAKFCHRDGHQPRSVWRSTSRSVEVRPGQWEASLSLDLSAPPTEIYCATCGVSLP